MQLCQGGHSTEDAILWTMVSKHAELPIHASYKTLFSYFRTLVAKMLELVNN